MGTKAEQLLETLIDLQRSRQRERELRMESEALLEGLRGITDANDIDGLFQAIVKVLHSVIEFDNAFILQSQEDGRMVSIASTSGRLFNTVWEPSAVFNRALSGRPVALFSLDQVPEWSGQPNEVRENIGSALHIGLHRGDHASILVVTHPNARHFGTIHIKKAERFAPLASQALLTLDLQRAVIQRDRFFQLSLDLMAIVSFNGDFRQHNAAWSKTLGYSEDEISKSTFFNFALEKDRSKLIEAVQHLEITGGQHIIELRFHCRDRRFRWLSCSLAAYADEQLCYVSARDITDRIIAQQQIEHEARHDPLTGLYNRAAFMERLKEALAYAARQPRYCFALLYLDLDRFKAINDSLGHSAGDELLKEVSQRILRAVREVDIVARIGGDEFVVLLTDVKDVQGAECVAQRLHRLISMPVVINGNEICSSTSIGITLSSFGYHDTTDVLRDADIAMYKAKSAGKSRYEVFNPCMHKTE